MADVKPPAGGAAESKNRKARWRRLRIYIRTKLATCRALQLNVKGLALLGNFHGAKAYLRKLRVGVVQRANTQSLHIDVQIEKQAQEVQQLMQQNKVVTQHEGDRSGVAMWQQGDASLATKDKLRARKILRRHEMVFEALNCFWKCVLRTEGRQPWVVSHPDDPEEKIVTRVAYESIMSRAYKVLLQVWDPDDAFSSIAEDWETDSQGGPGLSRAAFGDALFQIADMWVTAIDGKAYYDFLIRLFENVTEGGRLMDGFGGDGDDRSWRGLNDCFFDESLAGDDGDEDDEDDEDGRKNKMMDLAKSQRVMRKAAKKIQAYRRGVISRRKRAERAKSAQAIQNRCRTKLAKNRVQAVRDEKAAKAAAQPPNVVVIDITARTHPKPPRPWSSPANLSHVPDQLRAPFHRDVSPPRPSTPGRKGEMQRWQLRNAEWAPVVPPAEAPLHERRKRHDAHRARELAIELAKRSTAVLEAGFAAKAAKQAQLEEERQRRLERIQSNDEKRRAMLVQKMHAKYARMNEGEGELAGATTEEYTILVPQRADRRRPSTAPVTRTPPAPPLSGPPQWPCTPQHRHAPPPAASPTASAAPPVAVRQADRAAAAERDVRAAQRAFKIEQRSIENLLATAKWRDAPIVKNTRHTKSAAALVDGTVASTYWVQMLDRARGPGSQSHDASHASTGAGTGMDIVERVLRQSVSTDAIDQSRKRREGAKRAQPRAVPKPSRPKQRTPHPKRSQFWHLRVAAMDLGAVWDDGVSTFKAIGTVDS